MAPVTVPWDPAPGEGPKPYEAFVRYRDQGPQRSLRVVGESLGKSSELIERWSRTYGWVARVGAYDLHVDQVRRQAAEAEIAKMSARYAAIAAATSSKIVERLRTLAPDELRAGDIGPLLRHSYEIESKARGVPDRLEISGSLASSNEWAQTRGAILGALSDHPEALAAVLDALGGTR